MGYLLILLHLSRDLLFMAGAGWVLICLCAGLTWAVLVRLLRLARRLVCVTAGRGVKPSNLTQATAAVVGVGVTSACDTAHIDELFREIEHDNLTVLDYAGTHTAVEDCDADDGLIAVSYLGLRAAVCAPDEYWLTEALQPHAEADDAVYNMVRRMCDYTKLCRDSRPHVIYDDAEARAFALLANVPRELLTDRHLNAAAIAAQYNVPAWELTRENVEYACNLFPAATRDA